ncbi:DegT/DnrJ/EryC1/StrS family aminotransferase [Janibacter sp. GS2]|uniref:DegT/DnrJ/EryC1/StrS family aminotransferase n=1 Tax=Janibacter sp. GS2 TaxID=3442646 RepID=UPI003EB70AD9
MSALSRSSAHGARSTRSAPARFDFDLTQPDPIPEVGITRAIELMRSGRLFRYTEFDGEHGNDAADLEVRFAELVGRRYAVAVNSGGGAIFTALRACGVQPGDRVLLNGYTLAPVPGAIHHAGAEPVLVEITEDLTIDLADLRRKAEASGARTLLLSHMRGHVADLDAVAALCDELGVDLIEDCAHTLGADWAGRATGTFGRAGCFSAQTFKHLNSGEGGFLVTDDDEVAARAILHSGSYMLYEQHRARPPMSVFEPLRGQVANYSLRMTALAAALIEPQLDLLAERVERMNRLYRELELLVGDIPFVQLCRRPAEEGYVGSSFQFALPGVPPEQIATVVQIAGEYGLPVKWFGEPIMRGFTSRPAQWEYIGPDQELPRTEGILATLCDLRVPPSMQLQHCRVAADIIRFAVEEATGPA